MPRLQRSHRAAHITLGNYSRLLSCRLRTRRQRFPSHPLLLTSSAAAELPNATCAALGFTARRGPAYSAHQIVPRWLHFPNVFQCPSHPAATACAQRQVASPQVELVLLLSSICPGQTLVSPPTQLMHELAVDRREAAQVSDPSRSTSYASKLAAAAQWRWQGWRWKASTRRSWWGKRMQTQTKLLPRHRARCAVCIASRCAEVAATARGLTSLELRTDEEWAASRVASSSFLFCQWTAHAHRSGAARRPCGR